MWDIIHWKKLPFTELQCQLPCSEKPSRDSCHESNTTNPNLPSHFINTNLCIIFKPVWSSIVSTMTRTYNGNLGFKSWQKQETNITTKTSRQAPSAHSASNSMKTTAFSLAVKVARADSDHYHQSRAKFQNRWSYTSNQPVCLHGK